MVGLLLRELGVLYLRLVVQGISLLLEGCRLGGEPGGTVGSVFRYGGIEPAHVRRVVGFRSGVGGSRVGEPALAEGFQVVLVAGKFPDGFPQGRLLDAGGKYPAPAVCLGGGIQAFRERSVVLGERSRGIRDFPSGESSVVFPVTRHGGSGVLALFPEFPVLPPGLYPVYGVLRVHVGLEPALEILLPLGFVPEIDLAVEELFCLSSLRGRGPVPVIYPGSGSQ